VYQNAEVLTQRSFHCNFAYSALACLRMGMSGSASFQRGENNSLRQAHALEEVGVAGLGTQGVKMGPRF
jgi:ABC-type hemin transport system ATPase subunit